MSGGAFFTTNVQTLSLDTTSLDSNHAGLSGGALAVNGSSTVTLLRVSCTRNVAAQLGGCVYANGELVSERRTNACDSLCVAVTLYVNSLAAPAATSFLNLGVGTLLQANVASSGGGLWALDAAVACTQSKNLCCSDDGSLMCIVNSQ